MPEVSVVLPVFNGARTIARAVRSIFDQTLRDIELVVVDDGSSDDTVAIVQAIRDPRLRLVRRPHGHVAAAANAGTRLATAPCIARMDADDWAHPRRLEHQLQLLRDGGVDVVGCQVRIVDGAQEAAPTLQRYARWINEETLDGARISALRFVEFPLVNPTLLARRSYFELGFDHGDFPEDYDLMLRAAATGLRFGKVAEVLLDWTDGPGRLTRTDPRYAATAFERCRRRHLLSGPLRGIEQVDLWGVGQTGKPWLRWLQDHGRAVRRAYDLNGRQLGQTIHGIRVDHPMDLPCADGTPLIIAVGAEGARAVITPQLLDHGHVVGGDAWFVA